LDGRDGRLCSATSGVLSLDELQVFAGLDALAAVAIEQQRPIVESYARLSDQDLGDGGQTDAYAVELVDQLAAML
jgi:hypothetical protein